ncbi:molybdate ABC transporter substrate-binding protein [Marinobacter sp. LN3S78]|uniref:molybdate ABC transporter substrate-binding protein n=1 Tax=Marinobacter sp. LN3S78 TaxID=3382300 RepID=UPI00387B187C
MRIVLTACLLLLSLASPAHALTIAAASSLRLAMPELTQAFEQQYPDASVTVVFGASGKLASQVLNGAPYDLFLSADTGYPERLAGEGVTATDPETYAEGRLVLWHHDPQREALTPPDLTGDDIRRIAIAQPRHAPYGQRAKEALQALALWEPLQPKLVYGENIGQTAAMVESGAADAGLIAWSLTFAPDLAGREFTLIDDRLHQPLAMAMVITGRGGSSEEARQFRSFMVSEAAAAILGRFGFEAPKGH